MGHEIFFFMDGYSAYNIKMAPEDEELTEFCTPKSILCYKFMPFGLKKCRGNISMSHGNYLK
jgi:hypothetical protein